MMMMMGVALLVQPAKADFFKDFQVTWSPSKVKILEGGQQLQLVLDSSSGITLPLQAPPKGDK